ncbi:tyrosine-type recombinase/integrase [Halomarina oriensis]|uniref:Tyrosine-type recombinase/integrase n=1 Tax=Halomarina oriensis TaxID=671145 RepID=A0A6B0GIB3_9EURY|nr:tyrosine-type recombinase/integrase [Halomarina oriensis]MWG33617.1 tyrosine-type recombinase/integrase [Halomarina oriensis]
MSTDAVEDPVAYFLQDIEYHGRSERTRTAYERVLRQFERFVATESATPATATQRHCLAFVHDLREQYAPSTVATYATYVHRFYDYMLQTETFDGNPMALVMAEMDESIDTDPTRREVSVAGMREFVAALDHPLERALVVTLLKTGMRVGELVNLDLRDLSLDGELRAGYRVEPRPQLDTRPNSLYVDSEVTRGSVVDGEQREASNKRKRATVIPVDDELRHELERWLAIRPNSRSPAEPLFLDTGESWGRRLTTGQVRTVVRRHAEAHGWHREGGGASENVTPHYFRHFFTTHLRDRTGDRGVVKYLRGDVATDIIDTYTHDWGNRVREVYEANVYSLR